MRRLQFLASIGFVLSGCATLSFAPPQVRMDRQVYADNEQSFFNAVCTPNHADDNPIILHNVEGALSLIDNYILTYRCQRDRAAEGRQFFEVPGFLALAGGATAAAFGAAPAVAIATGAGSAAFNSGKGYYAPQAKAKVLSDGVTAMLCIHNEAVGIDGPTLEAISDVQANSGEPKPRSKPKAGNEARSGANRPGNPADDSGPGVGMTAERQYFNMISTALWSVEQFVADRLSNSGKEFDMDGVQAQLDKLKKEVADTTANANTEVAANSVIGAPAPAVATATDQHGNPIPDTASPAAKRKAAFGAAQAQLTAIGAKQVGETIIQLKTLKPKLDQCILKAKV
jgi:hypothetical protein